MNEVLALVIVGGIAGWLAGFLMGGRGQGIFTNIIVGVVGAFLGAWVFEVLGISIGSDLFGVITTATIGAAILLMMASLFS